MLKMSLDLSRNRMEGISGLSLISSAQRNMFNKMNNSVETSLPSPVFPTTSPLAMHHFMQAGIGIGPMGEMSGFPSPYGYQSFPRPNGTPSPKSPSSSHRDSPTRNERRDEGKEVKSCLICGDRATGLHYGIISCEGCKGFFKRSICNKRVYRCTKSKNCVMSRKQRNRCQFCRLLKCLQMGMNRKAIREDGMPGGRNKSIGPVQISDEEIERILSGKDFEEEAARDELQREQQKINLSNNTYPTVDFHLPGLLPFLPSLSQAPDAGHLQRSPTGSPPRSNGFDRSPSFQNQEPLKTNMLLTRGKPLSQFTSQSSRHGNREDSFHPSLRTNPIHLPHFAITQQEEINSGRSRTSILSTTPLVEQLVLSEDTTDLPHIDPQETAHQGTLTKTDFYHILCKIADEMLHRQILWIKKLPFFESLSIKDHTTLLSTTWAEILLLAALCLHEDQLLDNLAEITTKYIPDASELSSFGEQEMEILERITFLYNKFSNMKVDKEEYVIMKVINFLNQDIKGLHEVEKVEEINKKYWFTCQSFLDLRAKERRFDRPEDASLVSSGAARFGELMLCLPDVRFIAGRLLNADVSKLPVLFKAILHSCKYQRDHAAAQTKTRQHSQSTSSTPPSPTSSPPRQDSLYSVHLGEVKVGASRSMSDLSLNQQYDLDRRRRGSSESIGLQSTVSTESCNGVQDLSTSPRSGRKSNIE